jgi:hypothetical protein|uniref:Uncharacterized protein n=1 Tax=viral metagenome TaxID=1070528 RepID=A0A6C0LYR2_9ZZZZ
MRAFFIILSIILLLIIFSKKTTESFSLFSNPGKWFGEQVGDMVAEPIKKVWNGVSAPASFARDVLYNFSPNYTMMDRYLVKKNDWVRANKGMPPIIPSKVGPYIKFNFDNDKKEKKYSAGISSGSYGKSLLNTVA